MTEKDRSAGQRAGAALRAGEAGARRPYFTRSSHPMSFFPPIILAVTISVYRVFNDTPVPSKRNIGGAGILPAVIADSFGSIAYLQVCL